MKKTLLFLVAILAFNFTNAQAVGDTFIVNNIAYKVTSVSPNEAEVTGFHDPATNAVATLTIPVTAEDAANSTTYSITAIGDHAFNGNSVADNQVIETVVLPSSVVTIGTQAFRKLTNMKTINLENVVTTGDNSFNDCTALEGVLGKIDLTSLVTMTRYTFVRTDKITELAFSSSLTSIGTGAMFDMDGLASVNIPSSVTTIDDNFLRRCDALTSVQLNWADPSTVTFNSSSYLGDLTASNITLYVPTGTLALYQASAFNITGINIVEGTIPTTFVGQVFSDGGLNYTVTSLSPNEVAVSGGTTTATLTIPATATNGTDVFDVKSIVAGAFEGDSTITSVELPSTVTEIGDNAFRNCSSLTSLDTEHITTIGSNILRDTNGVTTLDLDNVTSLASNGLGRAYGLTGTVNLPLIESLGPYAFVFASNITTINLGSSFNSVDGNTFYGIPGLTALNIDAETPPNVASFTFNTTDPASVVLTVPNSTAVADYGSSPGWASFTNIQDGSTLSNETLNVETLDVTVQNGLVKVINGSEQSEVAVFDITGRLLIEVAGETVDVSSLSNGIYIVKVSNNNEELVKRIVKQ